MLIHYSKKPLGKILSSKQLINEHRKPNGLWVSVDDSWKEWCEGADFQLDHLVCETKITLNKTAKILHLSNSFDLDELTRQYGQQTEWCSTYIKWREIALIYDGIIIAPYCWGSRLYGQASSWYYGWDCASGCIWNAEAILSD